MLSKYVCWVCKEPLEYKKEGNLVIWDETYCLNCDLVCDSIGQPFDEEKSEQLIKERARIEIDFSKLSTTALNKIGARYNLVRGLKETQLDFRRRVKEAASE